MPKKRKEFDVKKAIEEVKQFLASDTDLSPSAKAMFGLLMTVISLMSETINELNKKLGLNSKNSSKPPSSDPFGRGKGGGKPKGRKGENKKSKKNSGALKKKENPDEIKTHKLKGKCNNCGHDLSQLISCGFISRQIWDVIIRYFIVEHQAEQATCLCGKKHTANFPEGVSNHIQYSDQVKALVSYFSQYQMIPFERVQEIFKDLFNLPLSEGTIFNSNSQMYNQLGSFSEQVKNALINGPLGHADETKINIAGKLKNLHVFSNDAYTYLEAHEKRGHQAMDEIGILPFFKGVLVHDCFSAYFKYDCDHALCGCHLLRELTFCEDMEGSRWAHEMRIFLEDLNELLKGDDLSKEEKDSLEGEYSDILLRGQLECPPPKVEEIKRKNKISLIIKEKKTKSRTLLERLKEKRKEILRFMHDPLVPFTNNLGERDFRMSKVQQRISGCFRSIKNANINARIRSYISTLKKQGIPVLEGLGNALAPTNSTLNQLFT